MQAIWGTIFLLYFLPKQKPNQYFKIIYKPKQFPIQYIVLGIVWVSKLSSNFGLGFVWDFFEGNKYCFGFVCKQCEKKILY